ncbi:hypothetical protein AYO21_07966 [Fonsecaea monophora]|uniref:Acyl-coenzyme A oxidase n=1 Tax=Fonsecaea monophora TaxID=254056 RepID=A0A177F303_9EURO|nr:hypothetical protein AYO21_07966 [Fonsecaea monophora]OAG37860.1 hypothetical protein AYO21_07966 [Fonsecaea monophora]
MADFTQRLKPADPQCTQILADERARSSIDTEQLARHLLADEFLERQKRILRILAREPVFSKQNQLNLGHPERYQLGLARAKTVTRLATKHGWDEQDYNMASYLIDEMGPYALQLLLFKTSIREQGSDAQKEYWLPKVDNWEIIGAYCQTELGHGSNVKGLECVARWDPRTREFEIHSPTLTASKWWCGSLGRTANHAVVVAQLLAPDPKTNLYKSYGPHQFIVQVRDMKTFEPLPRITIGDIGPKYGYAAMDNGYMLFDHLRVPSSALLSRYARFNAELGIPNTASEKPAMVYGSLTYVRAQIVMHARLVLARACTVAVRYLSIRHQFPDRDARGDAPEQAVLNYPTVQIRILPLLATVFALHYTGAAMESLYWQTRASIEQKGDFSRLAEMHASSSGLKSLCTTLVADGIETCRRAMGGHGFGGDSGMVALNNEYLSKPTVEGDNWMITQQTATYLIKRMSEAIKYPDTPAQEPIDVQFKEFLRARDVVPHTFDIFECDEDLVKAFQHRAAYLSYQLYQARVVECRPWTSLMISLHRASKAHSESLLVSNFYNAVTAASSTSSSPNGALDRDTASLLGVLFRLFALFTLDASALEFLTSNAAQVAQLRHTTRRIEALMARVRPHAVRLVDAWSIPDYLLASSLGRYDGDVYNDLFRRAHVVNPLNRATFNPDWTTDEIIKGEGPEAARRRIRHLALGEADERTVGETRARL